MNSSAPNTIRGIAVIGMSIRLPGVKTPEQLWHRLLEGASGISFFSEDEVLAAGVDPALARHRDYVKAGGYLEDIDCFDAPLFSYPRREAEIMDPQQRVFMECCAEVLERAGYHPATGDTGIGVFAGANISTYLMNLLGDRKLKLQADPLRIRHGIGNDYVATKVSYKLDLRGPSMTIQSACSTSLVAIHQACQSILNGECLMSLAGGTSMVTPQKAGYLYREGGINAPDGYCRAFDKDASGTVFTSGVGVVLLKDLQAAVEDRDQIYAVIRGSAINNDGADKVGYAAPSFQGQSQVIAEALEFADIHADEVGYIEAHGTGTKVGDPLEVSALQRALATSRRGYCGIGSIKSNYGHLGTAAGVVGFIKAVLAVHHGVIPATLHVREPNPAIDFARSPFYVARENAPWPDAFAERIAGVSSFGIGGTNAHVLVSSLPASWQPPPPATGTFAAAASAQNQAALVVLSARTETALATMRANLLAYVEAEIARAEPTSLHDIAHTLQRGRRQLRYRDAWVCRDLEDLRKQLKHAVVYTSSIEASSGQASPGHVSPGQSYVGQGLPADADASLDSLARQWRQGAPLDWAALWPEADFRRVLLPTYPFARERYWIPLQPLAHGDPSPAEPEPTPTPRLRDAGPQAARPRDAQADRVVFLFPGQGAQYYNMGRGLYTHYPAFAATVDACSATLRPYIDVDLREMLFGSADNAARGNEALRRTQWAQLALFVVEYALAKLWQSFGVVPRAMIGHSVGEYVAACLAGVFDLDTALRLIAARGDALGRMAPGRMMSIFMAESAVRDLLATTADITVDIAAINGPRNCVVGGAVADIERLHQVLSERGQACTRLHTSHAFHSRAVDPVMDRFAETLQQVSLQPPQIPFISNVSGTWIRAEEARDLDYWLQHMRRPVQFARSVQTALGEGTPCFLEVGPGSSLSRLCRRIAARPGPLAVSSLPHAKRTPSDEETLRKAIAQLREAGDFIDERQLSAAHAHGPLPANGADRAQGAGSEGPRTQALPDRQAKPVAKRHSLPDKDPDVARWFYKPVWRPQLCAAPAADKASVHAGYTWLFFANDTVLCRDLLVALRRRAAQVIAVYPGDDYDCLAADAYRLRPDNAAGYRSLLADLHKRSISPHKVAHVWSYGGNYEEMAQAYGDDGSAGDHDDELLSLGYRSLLLLAQAIQHSDHGGNIDIEIVANGLFRVLPTDIIQPAKAALMSPCQNIPRESGAVSMRCIDIGPISAGPIRVGPGSRSAAVDSAVYTRLVDAIVADMHSDDEVLYAAYRDGQRYVRTYERVAPSSSSASASSSGASGTPLYRRGGVYLILGGLGVVGYTIAQYLARAWHATIIVTGRRPLSPHTLDNDDNDDAYTREKNALLEQLWHAGAHRVLYRPVELTESAQVAALIADVRMQCGRLDGVFHCVGNTDADDIGRPFEDTDDAFSNMHLRPKLDGVRHLRRALDGVPCDFVMLISSNASLLGGMGFSAYAAGNWLLDSFADAYRGRWLVSNWDGWPRTGTVPTSKRDYRMTTAECERALELLGQLAGPSPEQSTHGPQIAVASADLLQRDQCWMRRRFFGVHGDTAVSGGAQAHGINNTGEDGEDGEFRAADIRAAVAELWHEVLGTHGEDDGPADGEDRRDGDFFASGGDSLLAVYLVNQIRERFAIKLTVAALIEQPTIDQLTALVARALSDAPQAEAPLPETLVRIAAGSAGRAPLFMVHLAGGTVYMYRDLAQALGRDQPVYGLQSPGQSDGDFLPAVEDMAAVYIDAVRTVQAHGPYYIGGASFGGVVAFEMAQQLKRLDQDVALVALIDTPGPGQRSRRLDSEDHILKYLIDCDYDDAEISVAQLAPLSWPDKLVYCQAKVRQARAKAEIVAEETSRMVFNYDVDQTKRLISMFRNNVDAHWAYRPQPYDGRLLFIRALTRRAGHDPQYPERPWTEVAQRGVDLHVTAGDHITINYAPQVHEVARVLQRYLRDGLD